MGIIFHWAGLTFLAFGVIVLAIIFLMFVLYFVTGLIDYIVWQKCERAEMENTDSHETVYVCYKNCEPYIRVLKNEKMDSLILEVFECGSWHEITQTPTLLSLIECLVKDVNDADKTSLKLLKQKMFLLDNLDDLIELADNYKKSDFNDTLQQLCFAVWNRATATKNHINIQDKREEQK